MISILIMCATGIATSTVIRGKVESWLKDNGYNKKVKIYQSKIADEMGRLNDYDIVISSTFTTAKERKDIITAIPLITGVGADKVYEQLEEQLKELDS